MPITGARRWLMLSILLLLFGAAGVFYAAWVRTITDDAQESNLFIDLDRKEVRYQDQTVHLLGSSFYYPRDRYTAKLASVDVLKSSGYKITQSPTQILIERSNLVQFEAHVIVALLWLTSLATVAVALHVILSDNAPDSGLLVWNTCVIFVLPGLRQAMAAAPAIGIYIDFYGFLCCEVLAVISLMLLTLIWMMRRN